MGQLNLRPYNTKDATTTSKWNMAPLIYKGSEANAPNLQIKRIIQSLLNYTLNSVLPLITPGDKRGVLTAITTLYPSVKGRASIEYISGQIQWNTLKRKYEGTEIDKENKQYNLSPLQNAAGIMEEPSQPATPKISKLNKDIRRSKVKLA